MITMKRWHLLCALWLTAFIGYHFMTFVKSLGRPPDLTQAEQLALARTLAACLHAHAEHHHDEGNENHDDDGETDR